MSVPISITEAETKLPINIQPNNLHISPSSPPVSPSVKPSFMSLISKLRPRSHGTSPPDDYPPSTDIPTSSSSYFPHQQPLASPPLSPCSYPSSPTFSPYDPNPASTSPQFQQQYQLLLQQHQVQKSQQNTHGQIFGVPLQLSIIYAKSNITYQDSHGIDHVYGQVPIIVAKCAFYLKNNAADVEGIFRLSGSSRRIKKLQSIFSTPPSYGKDLDWIGFTVHDAANVLRRYLNNLPEPIIPLDLYEKFHLPLFNSSLIHPIKANQPIISDDSITSTTSIQTDSNSNIQLDPSTPQTEINYVIDQYKLLIESIPDLNRHLLLYILDLLTFFASKSQKNLMPAANLAAIFQPSILSHPNHDMDPNAYHLSRAVVQFIIQHFRSIQPKLNCNSKKPFEIPSPKAHNLSRRHSKSMSSADVPQNISCLLSDQPKHLSKTNCPVPPASPPSGGLISSLKRASSFGRRRRTFSASNYLPIPKPHPYHKSPALASPSFSALPESTPLSSPTFAHEPFGFPNTVSSPRFTRSSSSSLGSSSDDGECDNHLYQSETPNSSNVTVGTELSSNSTTSASKQNQDPKTLQSRFRGHRRKISESLNQMSSMLARRSLSPLHKYEDHKPLHGTAEAAPDPSTKNGASLAGSNGPSHPRQPYEPVQIHHSLQSLSAEPEVNQYFEKSTDSDVDSLLCDTLSSTLVSEKKEK